MRWPHLLIPLLLCGAPAPAQGQPRPAMADRAETRGVARPTAERPANRSAEGLANRSAVGLANRSAARAARAPRASAAALASARAFLCPHGGTPQGRGRCARGPGLGAAGTGWLGDDPALRDWDQGLAPPNRAQAPCPPGTIAMPARDQPGVTRCVAG